MRQLIGSRNLRAYNLFKDVNLLPHLTPFLLFIFQVRFENRGIVGHSNELFSPFGHINCLLN